SADGNGGDENGDSIARRAGAGAFGSAGAGFASSRYAAARRPKKPFEQSSLAAASAAQASGAASNSETVEINLYIEQFPFMVLYTIKPSRTTLAPSRSA